MVKTRICSLNHLESRHGLPSPVPLIVAVHLSFYIYPVSSFCSGVFCFILFHSSNDVATSLWQRLSLHYVPFYAWKLFIHTFSITMETWKWEIKFANSLERVTVTCCFLHHVNLYDCNENNKGKSRSHKLCIFSDIAAFVMEIRSGRFQAYFRRAFLFSDLSFLSFFSVILIFFPFSFIFCDIKGC